MLSRSSAAQGRPASGQALDTLALNAVPGQRRAVSYYNFFLLEILQNPLARRLYPPQTAAHMPISSVPHGAGHPCGLEHQRRRCWRALSTQEHGAINTIRNGQPFAPPSGKLPGSLFHKPVHPSLMTTHASGEPTRCPLRIAAHPLPIGRLASPALPHKYCVCGKVWRAPAASCCTSGASDAESHPRRPGELQSSNPRASAPVAC